MPGTLLTAADALTGAPVTARAEHSFAGMHDGFLDVRGEDELLRRVQDCWASTFGARAMFYRRQRGLPMVMPLAVVVQRMVDAETSGVSFTVDPTTGADRIRVARKAALVTIDAKSGHTVRVDLAADPRADARGRERRGQSG